MVLLTFISAKLCVNLPRIVDFYFFEWRRAWTYLVCKIGRLKCLIFLRWLQIDTGLLVHGLQNGWSILRLAGVACPTRPGGGTVKTKSHHHYKLAKISSPCKNAAPLWLRRASSLSYLAQDRHIYNNWPLIRTRSTDYRLL